jgi:hypothetical protein
MRIPAPYEFRPLSWRSDLTVKRSSILLVTWLIVGGFGLNMLSQRRILVCAYQAAQLHCQLTTQRLIGPVEMVPLGQLKSAVVDRKEVHGKRNRHYVYYQVILITDADRGRFWLTSPDTEGFAAKSEMAEAINQFLAQPRLGVLRIEPDERDRVWFLSQVFGGLSLLLIGITGLTIRWWWLDRRAAQRA